MDTLIRGGTLVDGTGTPGRPADVAIDEGRVRLLDAGAEHEAAGTTIDATGLVVAPGFIDLHSHSGLVLLADGGHEPKIRQGVTTEVVGIDGLSYAPFARREDLDDLVWMNAGLDGSPPGLEPRWEHGRDLPRPIRRPHRLNVALMVGNTPLRINALGWDDVPADGRGHRPTCAHSSARRWRRARSVSAPGSTTRPVPTPRPTSWPRSRTRPRSSAGSTTRTCATRSATGILDPFREAIEIGRRGEAPSHITHFYHRLTFPGGPEPMLALVDDARAEGLDVTFDAYPYEWASTRLLILVPIRVLEGGPRRTKERLADRAVRDAMREEMRQRGQLYAGKGGLARRPGGRRSRDRSTGAGRGGRSATSSTETGADPVDTICDLLLAEDLRVNEVTPGPHTDGIRRFLRHPVAMVGTDSTFIGDKPSPRTYGSYPRILGQFVRGRRRSSSLEDAVHRMTGAPAARLGLRDRGVLRDGAIADLTVFDPARVRANATYDEPRQFPDGIVHVLVAGTAVVEDEQPTGARPGRSLRRGRD